MSRPKSPCKPVRMVPKLVYSQTGLYELVYRGVVNQFLSVNRPLCLGCLFIVPLSSDFCNPNFANLTSKTAPRNCSINSVPLCHHVVRGTGFSTVYGWPSKSKHTLRTKPQKMHNFPYCAIACVQCGELVVGIPIKK